MYSMEAAVIKVAEAKNYPPSVLQVGPDKNVMTLGLPNSILIGPGQVPQNAHTDLDVPKRSIFSEAPPH